MAFDYLGLNNNNSSGFGPNSGSTISQGGGKAPANKIKDQLYWKLKNNLNMAYNTPDLYQPWHINAVGKDIRHAGLSNLSQGLENLAAQRNAMGMTDSGVSNYLKGQMQSQAGSQIAGSIQDAENQMRQANYANKQQMIDNALNFMQMFRQLKDQKRMDIIQQLMAAEQMKKAKSTQNWSNAAQLASLAGMFI